MKAEVIVIGQQQNVVETRNRKFDILEVFKNQS